MKNKKIFTIVFLLTVIGIVFWYSQNGKPPAVQEEILSNENSNLYESAEFGFSFRYPKNYFLEEREVGNGERYHRSIVLTDDTEENRFVREGESPGREGPVFISVEIYQNNIDNLSIENWLIWNNNSNFKLSDGTFEEVYLDGKVSAKYSWSGLYEADTIALRHEENIMAITVAYIFEDEQIRKDFYKILESFNFYSAQ